MFWSKPNYYAELQYTTRWQQQPWKTHTQEHHLKESVSHRQLSNNIKLHSPLAMLKALPLPYH